MRNLILLMLFVQFSFGQEVLLFWNPLHNSMEIIIAGNNIGNTYTPVGEMVDQVNGVFGPTLNRTHHGLSSRWISTQAAYYANAEATGFSSISVQFYNRTQQLGLSYVRFPAREGCSNCGRDVYDLRALHPSGKAIAGSASLAYIQNILSCDTPIGSLSARFNRLVNEYNPTFTGEYRCYLYGITQRIDSITEEYTDSYLFYISRIDGTFITGVITGEQYHNAQDHVFSLIDAELD